MTPPIKYVNGALTPIQVQSAIRGNYISYYNDKGYESSKTTTVATNEK